MLDFNSAAPHQTFAAAAIAALRKIAGGDPIVARLILDWPPSRAEQATSEGRYIEVTIHATPTLSDPNPWDAGDVAKILPALSEIPGIDWSRPHAEWSCEQIWVWVLALNLVSDAEAARDAGGSVTNPSGAGMPDDPISL